MTVDSYNYLISGEALLEVKAFIANEENTYEQYTEVHTLYIMSDISFFFVSLFSQHNLHVMDRFPKREHFWMQSLTLHVSRN